MQQQLFKTKLGFATGNIHYLDGTGSPSDALADAAPVGSKWTDVTSGESYNKTAAGTGVDKWSKAATADELAALVSGISWREPADVFNSNLNTSALVADLDDDDTIDGVAVFDGMRILANGLDTENKNVYIVSGSTGAWSVTEDPDNTATNGDTLVINGGTEEGVRFTYNGTSWVRTDQASRDEFNFIRAYIGKDAAGNVLPQYASTNIVANDDSLRDAVGKIDTKLGAIATPSITRTFSPVVAADSFAANLAKLNVAVGADVTSTNHVEVSQSVNANLSSLDQFIGASLGANGKFITQANTVMQNLSLLDTAIDYSVTRVSTAGVTTATAVGKLNCRAIYSAVFVLEVSLASDNTNKFVAQYVVSHDGTATVDATDAYVVESNIMEIGNPIAGLAIDFVLSGTGAAQEVQLQVTASEAVDVKTTRIRS